MPGLCNAGERPVTSPSTNDLSVGQLKPQTTWGDYNSAHFVVQQSLAKMQTATLVEIVAVNNTGGVSPVGYVDIKPLVNQLDAKGKPVSHLTIHNVPYLRLQGGGNAIILDPEIGDIGVALFASRDISKVKKTRAQANPGSLRQFSFSDAMYMGGMLNGTPIQYIQFSATGIAVKSPTKITLDAPEIEVTGAAHFLSTIDADDEITAITTPVHGHTHIGPATAPPGPIVNTGAAQP